MQEKQWLLLVICAVCSEAAEQLKVPYDFAAYPSYKSYYKLRQNDKFLYKNPKVSKITKNYVSPHFSFKKLLRSAQ